MKSATPHTCDSCGDGMTRDPSSRATCGLISIGALAAIAVVSGAVGCRESASRAESSAPGAQSHESANADATGDGATGDGASAGIKEVTFDNVKFDMPVEATFQREMLTQEIEQLLGKRIRIRGYMLPSFRQSGIKQFVLVRDNLECCFGPGAALYDCMLVTMEGDATTDFSIPPVTVEGTLRFEEFKDPINDTHLAIYRLEGETVTR
ncbi:DUF3299 domain-containing protein [Pirellulales bacterium]|nr:DUF3299 domain-containing protein [Pirellulales bacterium]